MCYDYELQPLAVSGGDIDEDELDDEDELFMQQFRAARLRGDYVYCELVLG